MLLGFYWGNIVGMAGFIRAVINNLDLELLDRKEAQEALFYTGFLLENEGNYQEATRLLHIKNKILQRIVYFDSLMVESTRELPK